MTLKDTQTKKRKKIPAELWKCISLQISFAGHTYMFHIIRQISKSEISQLALLWVSFFI